MSDAVAVVGSAEIDYGVIDSSKIGLVQILITEGAAASDTIPTKYKTATPTKTEGLATKDTISKFKSVAKYFAEFLGVGEAYSFLKTAYKTFTEGLAAKDTFSKYKIAYKTFTEGLATKDTVTKFKLVAKTIIEYMGVGDYLEEIYNKVIPNHAKYDYPTLQVTNQSR